MPTLDRVLNNGEEAINDGVGPIYNALNNGLKTVTSGGGRCRRRRGTKRRSSSRRRRGTRRRRRGRR